MCHILLAQDDPFVDYRLLEHTTLQKNLTITLTPYGGHMGFLQKPGAGRDVYWLDEMIFYWLMQSKQMYF
jgi:predicted alpha/beta-fold hydrolase